MSVTEDDLINELRQFHEVNHPNLQRGEFIIQTYADINKISYEEADNFIRNCIKIGKMEAAGRRYVDGKMRAAFKIVSQ